MIIFDINSIIPGLDLNVWKDMFKNEKLLLYSSLEPGLPPFVVNEKDVVLIDIENMSDDEQLLIAEYINKKGTEDVIANEEIKKVIDDNNKKLITFLKTANDEAEGIKTEEDNGKED